MRCGRSSSDSTDWSSERVFVSVQKPSECERPVKLLASTVAVDVTKYSVPPFASENTPSGAFAGIIVNDGTTGGPALTARFENCTTRTCAAPDVSDARDIA